MKKISKCHVCGKEVGSTSIMTHAHTHSEIDVTEFKYRQLCVDYNEYDFSYDNLYKLYVTKSYSEKELAEEVFANLKGNRKIITFLLEYYQIDKKTEHDRCNNERVKQKKKDTFIEKYGVDHPIKTKAVRDKIKATCLSRYGVDSNLKTNKFEKLLGKGSLLEERVEEFLIISGIKYESHYIIEGKEFDFLCTIKNKKFLLEVNGDYWHGNPSKYKPTDIVKTHDGVELTASDIWLKDNEKKLIGEGEYEVRVVWETDLKKDFLTTMYNIINYGN